MEIYVWDVIQHANFGANPFGGGFSPKYVIYSTFVTFCTVLTFFSILSTSQTAALAHTLNGSNDVFPRKETCAFFGLE